MATSAPIWSRMTRMAMLSAAIAVVAAASGGPVQAQFFPPPPPPPPGYYPGQRYDRGPAYPQPRAARVGYTCATSRGYCELPGARQINAPCSCFIPGFGRKRGAVVP